MRTQSHEKKGGRGVGTSIVGPTLHGALGSTLSTQKKKTLKFVEPPVVKGGDDLIVYQQREGQTDMWWAHMEWII